MRSATTPLDQRRKMRPAFGPKEMMSPSCLSSADTDEGFIRNPGIYIYNRLFCLKWTDAYLEKIHRSPRCVPVYGIRLRRLILQSLFMPC